MCVEELRGPIELFSGEFTEEIKEEVTVDFQRFFVKIGGVRFDVKMKYASSQYSKPLKTLMPSHNF